MNNRYILDTNGEPIAADWMTWARWYKTADRNLAKTKIGDVLVSTVFLGLDHSFGDGPPLLWETMVFDCPGLDEYQERYATREEALAGHERAVAMVTPPAAGPR